MAAARKVAAVMAVAMAAEAAEAVVKEAAGMGMVTVVGVG